MKIDRNNYEIYAIDFLEGNLSEEDLKSFQIFLKQNPDISQEIKNLNDIEIVSEDIVFDDKLSLKKSEFADELDISYFDELCIRKIEDEIDENQLKDFSKFLEKEDNKKIFNQYNNTILKPKFDVVFKNKKLFKKTISFKKSILYAVTSIAAASILIFSSIKFINFENNNIKTSALNYQIEKIESVKEYFDVENNAINNVKENKKDEAVFAQKTQNNVLPDTLPEKIDNNRINVPQIEEIAIIDAQNIYYEATAENKLDCIENQLKPKYSLDEKFAYSKIYLSNLFNKKVETTEELVSNPIEFAQTAINGYNNLTEGSLKLEKVLDENGNVVAVNISSEKFEFTTNKIGR